MPIEMKVMCPACHTTEVWMEGFVATDFAGEGEARSVEVTFRCGEVHLFSAVFEQRGPAVYRTLGSQEVAGSPE